MTWPGSILEFSGGPRDGEIEHSNVVPCVYVTQAGDPGNRRYGCYRPLDPNPWQERAVMYWKGDEWGLSQW